jgi:hypothetical protein
MHDIVVATKLSGYIDHEEFQAPLFHQQAP